MALIAVNPRVISTPSPQGLALVGLLAEDSKTWKRGEIGFLTSGTITPLVATGKVNVYSIFAEDQATSTSTSTVKVRLLEEGTRLLISVMTNGTAATAATPVIGTKYGVRGLSNVSYLDTGTASGQFEVMATFASKNVLRDTYEDTEAAPGLVEVKFHESVS